MTTEEFDLEWLDLREPFDAFARNEALADALVAVLPARPRLLDLGAGTGSLLRWLAPRALVGKPRLFMSFAPPMGIVDVADPMGGPKEEFERALSLIEDGCKGLLDSLAPSVRKAI